MQGNVLSYNKLKGKAMGKTNHTVYTLSEKEVVCLGSPVNVILPPNTIIMVVPPSSDPTVNVPSYDWTMKKPDEKVKNGLTKRVDTTIKPSPVTHTQVDAIIKNQNLDPVVQDLPNTIWYFDSAGTHSLTLNTGGTQLNLGFNITDPLVADGD
jgi:hypothetical protein